jgi:hypothetical protein
MSDALHRLSPLQTTIVGISTGITREQCSICFFALSIAESTNYLFFFVLSNVTL